MTAHILLVEDEIKLAKLLELDLCDHGYDVNVVHDGLSGWQQAQDGSPDLIVLDWQLPLLTGPEICARLRAAGRTMPIIFTTALDDPEHRATALQAGANEYLVKPFGIDVLLQKIVTHLNHVPSAA